MASPAEAADNILDDELTATFQRRLLRWYHQHGRDLPWRQSTDPYHIFVSEIMLQKTQVARVIPFYLRFLRRFPTVGALARASLAEVKAMTDPLGYKVRGEWLKAAAEIVVGEYGGQFPKDLAELQKLPGVGRSTAGAILSLAFKKEAPILEANVIRTLTRFFAIAGEIHRAATRNLLWELSERLIPSGRAHLFNQAIMDLGALICTPRTPSCLLCPVNAFCQWPSRQEYEGPKEELPLAAEEQPEYSADS